MENYIIIIIGIIGVLLGGIIYYFLSKTNKPISNEFQINEEINRRKKIDENKKIKEDKAKKELEEFRKKEKELENKIIKSLKEEIKEKPEIKEEIKEKEIKQKEKVKTSSPYKIYPEFDINISAQELGMDIEEVKEFMQEFIQQINEEIILMKSQINEQNWKELEKTTHRIKGVAANLRINGILECVTDFDNYLKENSDLEQIEKHWSDFNYYFDKFCKDKSLN